eukprot:1143893-Pelagomonas_calceolata.AAC.7
MHLSNVLRTSSAHSPGELPRVPPMVRGAVEQDVGQKCTGFLVKKQWQCMSMRSNGLWELDEGSSSA